MAHIVPNKFSKNSSYLNQLKNNGDAICLKLYLTE